LTVSDEGGQLSVLEHGCEKAKAGYERVPVDSQPQVSGKTTDLKSAIKQAAQILSKATRPLFAGLATDVDCMRDVMSLADRLGATVDHMHTDAMMRNVRTVQTRGWMITTMAEVRNRADFILFVGTTVSADFPRFYERLYCVDETLFGLQATDRECVFVGQGLELPKLPKGYKKPQSIPCATNQLFDVLSALRALVNGQSLQASTAGGVKLGVLTQLVEKMRRAKYGVIVWDGGKFDFPNSDLIVQLLTDIIRDMNASSRFVGFPLVGNNGGASAQSVCAWQSGYPLRVNFSAGYPIYDPLRYSTANVLESSEADALLWISTITAGRMPPSYAGPTIVLMEPGVVFDKAPDVYIPVGTPGMHHGGRLVRCDNVVSLPLRAPVVDSPLPTVAEIATSLQNAI
jgi:formylmethanofuran dehydrogenase subunit B